jgi:hypothetical protein
MTAVLILFGNSVDKIPESYKPYLVNALPETFSLIGAPIRLSMHSGGVGPTRGEVPSSAAGRGRPVGGRFAKGHDVPMSKAQ